MTHLQEKPKREPESQAGWWRAVLVCVGIFSPILPGSLNVAQAQWEYVTPLGPISWLWSGESFTNYTLGKAADGVVELLFTISTYIVTWSGWLLDISVEYFVLDMADQVNRISAIDGLWETFRDLGNIAFIGVLLYIAIRTVLDIGNKFSTKQLLVRLVIVALFVNFSLFATKVVVDTSNVVALQFYNAVQVEDCGLEEGCNLSHFFADSLNISSVNSPETINSVSGNYQKLVARFMGTLFMLTTAFVMGAMALLMTVRFVVLVLLMIASPLAFIAFALPKSDLGMKWVNKLLSQSFFAPAMLAMVYITASLAGGIQEVIGGQADTDLMAAIISNDSDSFSVILVFIILIGLMAASLIVAKKVGAIGAEKTVEWGKKARNWGQATVVGAAGGAARSTFGMAGQAVDKRFKKTRLAQTYFGDKVREGTTKKLADAKFGTKTSAAQIAKDKKGAKARTSSYDVRQDVKKEIEQATDDATKRRNLNRLSSKEKVEFGKDFLKEHAELLSENDFKAIDNHDGFSEREKQEIKEAAVETLESLRDPRRPNPSTPDIKAFLGTRSKEQLKNINIELMNQPEIIKNMTSDQFDDALKGRANLEQLSMKRERLEGLNRALNNNDVQSYFAGMKDEDIAKLIKLASDSTINDINNNPALNPVRMDLRTNDQVIDELGISIGAKIAEEGLKRGEKDALLTAAKNRRNQPGHTPTDKNTNFVDWAENGQGKTLYS